MRDPDAIEARGIVVEAAAGRTRFRVRMPNGHFVFGYGRKSLRKQLSEIQVGDTVVIFLSPADMASGEIIKKLDSSNL